MRTDSTKSSSTHLGDDPDASLDHGTGGRVLRRRLKLRHIVFLGLAYMAPLAVFDTFGIVAEATEGRVPLAYLLILVAVAITAFSYARMSRYYPRAGSAYTYAKETINPHVGFMVGWAATLDYLLLPMLNALLAAIYMGAVLPAVPAWVWVLSTIVICTVLNVVGVKLAAQVNVILVVVQIVVAAAFLFFAIRSISAGADGASVSLLPFDPSGVPTGALLGGASLLALSFLGFDAVTTMSEEAIRPKTDIPLAIMIIVIAAGGFFIAITYTMQVLFPDVAEVGDIVAASPEIAQHIGGALFQALFVGGYMFAVLGCGLTQQMSAARLLYAMGRDGTLPKRMFGRVSARTGVPIVNVVFIAVLACSALFLDLASAASLINFGAYIAFGAVNLSLIFATVKHLRPAGRIGVFSGIVLPMLGLGINVALWVSLDANAKIVGIVWALVGLVFLLVRTRLFREPAPAMAEPELD
ncbi:putrescine importer [Brevibacterium sanguinis]|uniref:Putrescine importer n=2 Tax=Brevibacterium TaxID=1696 RepID=A0A366IFV9_9MICO|nr:MULTISPECIES: APC family permease [Brevibacterium]RBP63613.1 putrescine importer [Brevibacterium sanguinis]RBP70272.1 putrescine importer [Brevibacterium celere]